MVRLRDDKTNLTIRGRETGGGRQIRAALPLLMFVCLALLVLSRINHSALRDVRAAIAEWTAPILQAAMIPFEPLRNVGRQLSEQFETPGELDRLRNENQKLSNWEWRARELERKLRDLEATAKVSPAPDMQFLTSRVIADQSGVFTRSVIIAAGNAEGVKIGYPVINGDGLVGRIVESGANSARVLLLADLNSRVPVVVGANGVRAVLAGDNGSTPKLIYVTAGGVVNVGDDVSTSAAGGVFPRGLRIGTVVGGGSVPRVKLRAALAGIEYLSVLFHDSPALELMGPPTVERRPQQSRAKGIATARDAR